MFGKLFPKSDNSGFTRKDKKIFETFMALWSEGHAKNDTSAADAYLANNGWTQDYLEAVMDHFSPVPTTYTNEQINAAKVALEAFNAGDEEGCMNHLAEAGLSVSDMAACGKQYWDEVRSGSREHVGLTGS
ncbi:hypothetical protein AB0284_20230 [Pseudarthrobacter phenanthrenivorans]|uniref:hypothetical protein n=1 Tax=Pseudarthrobacter phenanthrenivorans TaxID=361575 RepID=UPI003450D955